MARYPVAKKTILIREVRSDTYPTFFDYWLDTERLNREYDEVHTIWTGPLPENTGAPVNQPPTKNDSIYW
jgi:hypothetical protein